MRKALLYIGCCFLVAVFVVGFMWAHGAHTLTVLVIKDAEKQRIFLAGYAAGACMQAAPLPPLQEKTGITQPIWATPIGETWLMKEY